MISWGSCSPESSQSSQSSCRCSLSDRRHPPNEGGSDQPCYGNSTCDDGLYCANDGYCYAAAGKQGEACYGNKTCDGGLVCDTAQNVCVSDFGHVVSAKCPKVFGSFSRMCVAALGKPRFDPSGVMTFCRKDWFGEVNAWRWCLKTGGQGTIDQSAAMRACKKTLSDANDWRACITAVVKSPSDIAGDVRSCAQGRYGSDVTACVRERAKERLQKWLDRRRPSRRL